MVATFSKPYDKIWVGFCFNTGKRNFETNFLENGNLFQKTVVWFFSWKYWLRLKMHYFHRKLSCQKPILKQIEWWVQNGPITKNEVLPVTTLFFWKFCFIIRTSFKELIWSTNYPSAHIHAFRKRSSFIWGALSLWVSLIL